MKVSIFALVPLMLDKTTYDFENRQKNFSKIQDMRNVSWWSFKTKPKSTVSSRSIFIALMGTPKQILMNMKMNILLRDSEYIFYYLSISQIYCYSLNLRMISVTWTTWSADFPVFVNMKLYLWLLLKPTLETPSKMLNYLKSLLYSGCYYRNDNVSGWAY